MTHIKPLCLPTQDKELILLEYMILQTRTSARVVNLQHQVTSTSMKYDAHPTSQIPTLRQCPHLTYLPDFRP